MRTGLHHFSLHSLNSEVFADHLSSSSDQVVRPSLRLYLASHMLFVQIRQLAAKHRRTVLIKITQGELKVYVRHMKQIQQSVRLLTREIISSIVMKSETGLSLCRFGQLEPIKATKFTSASGSYPFSC